MQRAQVVARLDHRLVSAGESTRLVGQDSDEGVDLRFGALDLFQNRLGQLDRRYLALFDQVRCFQQRVLMQVSGCSLLHRSVTSSAPGWVKRVFGVSARC